ncbi:hypothetical protein [Nocardioides sp. Kera G14]|uniref:hypothetical protein n=1 Tax=Nocardioides sp. Kera G14 TaxID=2884264 RepID=UPI001D10641F|nr:hypothetical protein [Nocardioides sp. Kera G14]UDY23398.1 hypothetical protein LH076_15250 [Nocardioides sp. Kera G14]
MSLVALGHLAHDLDRQPDAPQQLATDPVGFLAGYDLTETERSAVLDLDAQRLVDLGLNPMLMWNILGAAGVGPRDLYSHTRRLT